MNRTARSICYGQPALKTPGSPIKTMGALVFAMAVPLLSISCGGAANQRQESPMAQEFRKAFSRGESGQGEGREVGSKYRTTVFNELQNGRNYIILINQYDDVKALQEAVGLPGKYGHIEVIRDGVVYGCRPPRCGRTSLDYLEEHYDGVEFELREVDIQGDAERAMSWFVDSLEGKRYDLTMRNCTDAVAGMYAASGDRRTLVVPYNVEEQYGDNAKLRTLMRAYGIEKPDRETIFFPDQFTDVGDLVTKGEFGK